MSSVMSAVQERFKKSVVVDIRTGDTVRVHQRVREGNKERVQIFQGLVIRTLRKGSHTSSIMVHRIASGVAVERSFLLHSPLILKIEVTKRSKVRRNYLTYMRSRAGKAARLTGIDFDREAVNAVHDKAAEEEEAKLKAEAAKAAEEEASKKEAEEAKLAKKAAEVVARHEQNT